MKTVLLDKLVKVHSMGSNCCTNSIRTILKYYDYDVSEDLVFGLGSGLGFIYQNYLDEGYFISGRNESLEFNLAYLLEGELISDVNDCFQTEWEKNKEFLEKGIPIIVDLSIPYLPYYKRFTVQSENVAFGLHNAVLAGYDDEGVYLLEHRWSEVLKISHEDYQLARSVHNTSVSPQNAWKVLRVPEKLHKGNMKPYIVDSIQTMLNRIRQPFAFKIGLKGLEMFCKEVEHWNSLPQDELKRNLMIAGVYLERLGTGGGNFRRMYSRFLKEAAGYLDNALIQQVAAKYSSLASEWKQLVYDFDEALCKEVTIIEDKSLIRLQKILEMEVDAVECLLLL
ncbi:DUF4872 domain-containing protein [Paenibacillus albiflavus]|uniref:DUF4872 domain-containing protein n=1 Tax=Paenibacillus albiflavus TaxID=2545760 RepID=A0A4R4EG07_9BACL|nr:BtrH N-terminal domain-containing protein [Paenibacillus albiflavus]TCZ77171.1 DUF4872 domain-containing protein [Paenibacillus albiflavus]